MGQDIYLRREIADILRATACASEASSAAATELLGNAAGRSRALEEERLLQAYRQGVCHALVAVGLAFGLRPARARPTATPEGGPALGGLLWTEIPRDR